MFLSKLLVFVFFVMNNLECLCLDNGVVKLKYFGLRFWRFVKICRRLWMSKKLIYVL